MGSGFESFNFLFVLFYLNLLLCVGVYFSRNKLVKNKTNNDNACFQKTILRNRCEIMYLRA